MSVGKLAVLFDVDGTLVDSEQAGHRVAFNRAFEEFGLHDRWSTLDYVGLLRTTGGVQRLRQWFGCTGHTAAELLSGPQIDLLCSDLHRRKTEIFVSMCTSGAIPARLGATRLVQQLVADGVPLAIATTGHRAWVEPLIHRIFGEDTFGFMVTGNDVRVTKPDPEVYRKCLELLPRSVRAVALEDSIAGLRSATGAGVPCVLVINPETNSTDWGDAALVMNGYGHEDSAEVLYDPNGLCHTARLTTDVLRQVADVRSD